MKRFVLPKQLRLPGGFVVRFQESAMTDDDAHWEYSANGYGVIRYAKRLTKAQLKYHISHELIHAMVDYHHYLINQELAGPW